MSKGNRVKKQRQTASNTKVIQQRPRPLVIYEEGSGNNQGTWAASSETPRALLLVPDSDWFRRPRNSRTLCPPTRVSVLATLPADEPKNSWEPLSREVMKEALGCPTLETVPLFPASDDYLVVDETYTLRVPSEQARLNTLASALRLHRWLSSASATDLRGIDTQVTKLVESFFTPGAVIAVGSISDEEIAGALDCWTQTIMKALVDVPLSTDFTRTAMVSDQRDDGTFYSLNCDGVRFRQVVHLRNL